MNLNLDAYHLNARPHQTLIPGMSKAHDKLKLHSCQLQAQARLTAVDNRPGGLETYYSFISAKTPTDPALRLRIPQCFQGPPAAISIQAGH